MSWRYRIVGAIVFTLVAIQSPLAHAQYGYPYGYGNYGWGGWGGGGTVQGSIARGMGAYAAGAGYYNQSTAVARSINADTVMRWNQYVYQSQMNANRIHAARLARDRNATIQDVDKIQKRLRDNPEPADITAATHSTWPSTRSTTPGCTPRPFREPRPRSAARRFATSPSSPPRPQSR